MSKRAFYASLKVPELWIWRNDDLEIHQLAADTEEYSKVSESILLPGLPIQDLVECARIEITSQAIKAFRKRIESTES